MVYSQAAISFKRAHLLFRPGDACLAPFADARPETGFQEIDFDEGIEKLDFAISGRGGHGSHSGL